MAKTRLRRPIFDWPSAITCIAIGAVLALVIGQVRASNNSQSVPAIQWQGVVLSKDQLPVHVENGRGKATYTVTWIKIKGHPRVFESILPEMALVATGDEVILERDVRIAAAEPNQPIEIDQIINLSKPIQKIDVSGSPARKPAPKEVKPITIGKLARQ